MECKFHVGQKVVCIRQRRKIDFKYPKKGSVMTVRDVVICPFTWKVGIRLHEHVLPLHPNGQEFILEPDCFQPVAARPTSIDVFKAMLTPKTERVPA